MTAVPDDEAIARIYNAETVRVAALDCSKKTSTGADLLPASTVDSLPDEAFEDLAAIFNDMRRQVALPIQ